MNVLINSAEAIDGNGTIFVSTRVTKGLAIIELRDDGPGISANDLPHVFEPGFTTKGVRVGAGLGLAIVQRAVLDLRGTVEASSEPGGARRSGLSCRSSPRGRFFYSQTDSSLLT
jgi:signal transduction histidine kinase